MKGSIRKQPETLKWFSDPDRTELLFQASRLDDIGVKASDLLRKNIHKNIEALTEEVKDFIPKVGEGRWEALIKKYVLPSIGMIRAKPDDDLINRFLDEVNPEVFESIHKELQSTLTKFNPKDIGTFSELFTSLNTTTKNQAQRTQALVENLISDYFSSLTLIEKSKILSDYFKAPIVTTREERLRPLLQNLDPVMQKIFQLFGRLIKNESIEAAVSILQSSLTPFPIEIMKAKFQERTGHSFDELFKDYDASTIRRGTTGQVLFATRIDNGERVAIKIRTPDLIASFEAAKVRLLNLPSVKENPGLSEFVASLLEVIRTEIDYREEARFTDLARKIYTDLSKGIVAMSRVPDFEAAEDLVIYRFSKGIKPTKLTSPEELKVRSKGVHNLIELWTESVFFKNIETDDPKLARTTLFHGDLHPGNILIDVPTETLTILDFGNVGFFPIAERRNYIRLFLASTDPTSKALADLVIEIYGEKGLKPESFSKLKEIGELVWNNPDANNRRLDAFLSRATDEVGLPVEKSISSFTRAIAFLKIEVNEINKLLDNVDPNKTAPRLEFSAIVKKTFVKNLKKEFPETIRNRTGTALVDRELLADALKSYLKSHFVSPCLNLFQKRKIP